MKKQSVGVVQGKSGRVDPRSLRDQIVDDEHGPEGYDGSPEEPPELPEPNEPPPGETIVPVRTRQPRKSGKKRRNDRRPINYFGALDDIIADIYEKQAASYKIVKAVTQLFESRGQDVPFEEERFNRLCGNLAEVQSAREIAYLYGLGPEHADKVATLMIERLFGPPTTRRG